MQRSPEYWARIRKATDKFWDEMESSPEKWKETVMTLDIPDELRVWLLENSIHTDKYKAQIEDNY
ncbi:hypothetical protein SAMN05444266_101726 [Chitinophaga jiangningensis]|uniref:Uncharacterized protein n=1 Tax=Chitinophaga jiangningensis TaxID=1419482 RepID=A0A1M6WQY3_9BACT|nr:hypothetical protein [Chitinophaga jiangningensis]SHK95999.1 hypothetical protein SAMN05444266_101726 [Chitinophaga jiangningensis]